MPPLLTQHLIHLLAVAEDAGQIDLAIFAQYGVLGLITALLIWFAKGAHQRERDRGDRLEAEVGRLHTLMLDRVIPALTSASRAAEESAELLRAVQREREQELAHLAQRRNLKGGETA